MTSQNQPLVIDPAGFALNGSQLSPTVRYIILVDGTCLLCSWIVKTVLARDKQGIFGFSHIQGAYASEVLDAHGVAIDVDVIYLVLNAGTPHERVVMDGAAGREIWPRLHPLGKSFRLTPLPLLNLYYRFFAKIRFLLVKPLPECRMPTAEERGRFLA